MAGDSPWTGGVCNTGSTHTSPPSIENIHVEGAWRVIYVAKFDDAVYVLHAFRKIDFKGLTQEEAAKMFGVRQSRVSDLVRGKWERFSLDTLVTLALRAGMHVELNLAA
ncbi:MAG: XRE family transcriptional regulator [Nitrospirae bacterium]|nr:XRE family transcriptional regulator [Magnetococcales bacterium]